MKVYINCNIPAQILYLGKSGSCDMDQKTAGHLDCRIFKSTISLEQNGEIARVFACMVHGQN